VRTPGVKGFGKPACRRQVPIGLITEYNRYYFLDEKIVNYFEFKKCSERLNCEGFGSRSRFQLQNPGLIKFSYPGYKKSFATAFFIKEGTTLPCLGSPPFAGI